MSVDRRHCYIEYQMGSLVLDEEGMFVSEFVTNVGLQHLYSIIMKALILKIIQSVPTEHLKYQGAKPRTGQTLSRSPALNIE